MALHIFVDEEAAGAPADWRSFAQNITIPRYGYGLYNLCGLDDDEALFPARGLPDWYAGRGPHGYDCVTDGRPQSWLTAAEFEAVLAEFPRRHPASAPDPDPATWLGWEWAALRATLAAIVAAGHRAVIVFNFS